MLHVPSRSKGFTVVELLVVISVIVVLTTILIFAYSDWRQRAADAEVKTALNHLATALKNDLNFKNTYPLVTVPDAYKPTDGVTISYTATASTYCVSGTSVADPTIIWYISSSNQVPSKTTC